MTDTEPRDRMSLMAICDRAIDAGDALVVNVDSKDAAVEEIRSGRADVLIRRPGEADWMLNAFGMRGNPTYAVAKLHDRTLGSRARDAFVRMNVIDDAVPSDVEVERCPMIYAFVNSGHGTDWQIVMALAEDGTFLASHCSSSEGWAWHDIGYTSDWKHDKYAEHYPDGYVIEPVPHEDVRTHAGLQAAYELNQQQAREAEEIAR